MDINQILKNVILELCDYYKQEGFNDLEIKDEKLFVDLNLLICDFNINNLNSLNKIINDLIILKEKNYESFTKNLLNSKKFAITNIIITNAIISFIKVREASEDLILSFDKNNNTFSLISLNEKFVLRKLIINCQRVLLEFSKLSSKILNDQTVFNLLESLKEIIKSDNVFKIFSKLKLLLDFHKQFLKKGFFVDDIINDDFCFLINDIDKLTSANSEFVGLLINLNIFSDLLKNNGIEKSKVQI